MPDWTILIPAITSLFSAGAAILAWLAKLKWSQEFAAAKDETIKAKEAQIAALRDQFAETIRAKDAQIEALRELTPMKIHEYFLSVKQQLEEYIDKLKVDLVEAQRKNAQLMHDIEFMLAEQTVDKIRYQALQLEHQALEEGAEKLQRQIEEGIARTKELDKARESFSRVARAEFTMLSFLDDSGPVAVLPDDSSDDAEAQQVSSADMEHGAS